MSFIKYGGLTQYNGLSGYIGLAGGISSGGDIIIANNAPPLSNQYYSPYIVWSTAEARPVFDMDPTPENFANSEINDRWDYWNRMFVGINSPNGYVLGTLPVPTAQTVGTSWNWTGQTTGLAINSSNGQITVSDNTGLTQQETRSVAINTPGGGTYNIQIPVVNLASAGGTSAQASGAFRFFGGDDVTVTAGSTGKEPHIPLGEIYKDFNSYIENAYLKRGATFTGQHLQVRNSFGGSKYKSYGDPSAARPKIILSAAYASSNNILELISSDFSNSEFWDLDLDCNNASAAIVGMSFTGGSNIKVVNCKVHNNYSDANSSGFRFNNVDQVDFRHCITSGHQGDGFYIVSCSVMDVGFNDLGIPAGTGADAGQTVNEGQTTQFNYDVNVHDCIGLVDPALATGKGAFANEGNVRFLFEYNWCQSDTFCGSGGDFFVTSRFNYYQGNDDVDFFATGHGPSQSSGPTRQYGCIINNAPRGISWSGFNATAENWQGGLFHRSDLEVYLNVGSQHNDFLFADQPWTGVWAYNYGFQITDLIDDRSTVANVQGTVTRINVSGSEMSLVTPQLTHAYPGASITVTDSNAAANNITGTIKRLASYQDIRIDVSAGIVSTSGGSISYQVNQTYTDKTFNDNYHIDVSATENQTMAIPKLKTGNGTGVIKEGEKVICSATLPSNHTARFIWYINGQPQTIMGFAASAFVPYNVAGIDSHRPILSGIGRTVNGTDLGCGVEILNTVTSAYNLHLAVWDE